MENRERIAAEALTLFAEKGFAGVGIQEIVDKSAVSKPTLYHYFGSKEGLFAFLLDRDFRPMIGRLESLSQSERDIFTKLKDILAFMLSLCHQKRSFFRIYLHLFHSPLRSEENRIGEEHISRIVRIVEDMFIEASYSHGNMRGRHRNYSANYLGLVNSCIARLLSGEIANTEDFVHTTIHYFAHGIFS